jgi:hypothetical protein
MFATLVQDCVDSQKNSQQFDMCFCVIRWQPLRCTRANFMAFTMTLYMLHLKCIKGLQRCFELQTWQYVIKVDYFEAWFEYS